MIALPHGPVYQKMKKNVNLHLKKGSVIYLKSMKRYKQLWTVLPQLWLKVQQMRLTKYIICK